MTVIDIHTHLPAPRPGALISATPEEVKALYNQYPEQLWSVGYHPWDITGMGLDEGQLCALRDVAGLERVAAIGETGIDKTRLADVPLACQINAFRQHIEIADELHKPLILHAVKAQDIIIPMFAGVNVPVVIHGFRQKPSIAEMYFKAGCYLSFGEQFNPEALALTPEDRVLAETDCSPLPIATIISRLHESRPAITEALIIANTNQILQQ